MAVEVCFVVVSCSGSVTSGSVSRCRDGGGDIGVWIAAVVAIEVDVAIAEYVIVAVAVAVLAVVVAVVVVVMCW